MGKRKHAEEEEEELLLEQLEAEVQAMAQRVMEYRQSVPDLLTTLLTSHLVAQRPTDPPPALAAAPAAAEPPLLAPEDDHSLPHAHHNVVIQDKLRLFRAKAQTNMAAMPHHFNSLQQSIHKLHQIHHFSLNLHPTLPIQF